MYIYFWIFGGNFIFLSYFSYILLISYSFSRFTENPKLKKKLWNCWISGYYIYLWICGVNFIFFFKYLLFLLNNYSIEVFPKKIKNVVEFVKFKVTIFIYEFFALILYFFYIFPIFYKLITHFRDLPKKNKD